MTKTKLRAKDIAAHLRMMAALCGEKYGIDPDCVDVYWSGHRYHKCWRLEVTIEGSGRRWIFPLLYGSEWAAGDYHKNLADRFRAGFDIFVLWYVKLFAGRKMLPYRKVTKGKK